MSNPRPSGAPSAWECRECLWFLLPLDHELLVRRQGACPGCGRAVRSYRPLFPAWRRFLRPGADPP
jgi:hypothetical protein